MKNSGKTLITAAAISGLLAGVAVNQGCSSADSGMRPSPGRVAPVSLAPKVHDCNGDNDCKGLGGCKTADHACKFKNDCKGKGGCHISDDDIKAWEKTQKSGTSGAPSQSA